MSKIGRDRKQHKMYYRSTTLSMVCIFFNCFAFFTYCQTFCEIVTRWQGCEHFMCQIHQFFWYSCLFSTVSFTEDMVVLQFMMRKVKPCLHHLAFSLSFLSHHIIVIYKRGIVAVIYMKKNAKSW